jgi:feruloyl esterase
MRLNGTTLHGRISMGRVILLLLLSAGLAGRAVAAPCENLGSISLADTKIVSATTVTPNPEWQVPGVAKATVKKQFCRVQGVIEKEIEFEVWLPQPAVWNGKYLGAGTGGTAGIPNYLDMARGVDRGYATAGTDAGHKITDTHWALEDPDRLVNLGQRSNHLLQERAKKIIAAYYMQAPKYSYFIGCSGGGRMAMKEAQQYPDDYDGIIAGTPAPVPSIMSVRNQWVGLELAKASPVKLTDDDWQLVVAAGLKSCKPAAVDGVAEDPRSCQFDLSKLQCDGDQHEGCLSAEKVKLVTAIYGPLRDENGKQLDSGMVPGTRLERIGPSTAGGFIGEVAHHDPNWDGTQLRIVDDLPGFQKAFPDWDINNPDLRPFKSHHSKLIGYQGWVDPIVLPMNTIHGYETVIKVMGGESNTEDFYRLFMVPGMSHCGGGPGANQFGGSGADAPIIDPEHDLLSALAAWVEKGQAPERIIASRVEDGQVVRTHPLCPYPEKAQYMGAGSTGDASNWQCVRERPAKTKTVASATTR